MQNDFLQSTKHVRYVEEAHLIAIIINEIASLVCFSVMSTRACVLDDSP